MDRVAPRARTTNVFVEDRTPLVAKIHHLNGDYLQESVRRALASLGGLDKAIRSGDRVMIKPNFNCQYATPLSTDLGFLAAVIEVLLDAGANLSVGELSGRVAWPTDKVVADLGVLPVLSRYHVPFINFGLDEWVALDVPGRYWSSFQVPRSIYEADKRVYLANIRGHSTARFSASLKLGVGWISPEDREYLHEDAEQHELKISELNLGWQPDVVLLDGRRSTATSHGRGGYVYPNVLMASGDMVAIDAEAVKMLKRYPEDNRLNIPLEEMGQFKVALEHRLGSMDYKLVETPARTRTEQEGLS